MTTAPPRGIAIIGMACRFPGAETPAEFWQNLRNGSESITFFSDEELRAAGVDSSLLQNRNYVKASPVLRNADAFDAAFFGYSPREAAIMDPQHRLFLETCWEAFEDAGYDPLTHDDAVVGVFAGAGSALTSYFVAHHDHPDMQGQTAGLQHINNDKDFLATRVSYKLNLTGPSLTVQTACSTALVGVHLACQSLLSGECDVALAGASTVRVPHVAGYIAERGSVHSSDGHCKAFDSAGVGTIFGSGVAAVLLKPVAAALADGDHIYAVVTGSAITNDGASKISYTAASAVGQARAVVEALEAAQVSADSIGYVECHATGTPAGDPVEIQALTKAFRLHTRRKGFCAVGSVKTNIGHPEQTAGLAGLIKTALSLEHGQIPPTVHFTTPNPAIPFVDSPFYVQSTLADWPRGRVPRRAAVNSLGIGGTNAFVVLEEAPAVAPASRPDEAAEPSRGAWPAHLFCISAKTAPALQGQAQRFLRYLHENDDIQLGDVCHTVNASRSAHRFRFAATCAAKAELKNHLQFIADRDPHDVAASAVAPRRVAFLFSGQGTQYPGMSAELYRTMPRYRAVMDECDAVLRPHLETSLLEILFAREEGSARLNQTRFAQPALFAMEYALAELWRSWGIVPGAVMGHSVGELVAACVAGVLDFRAAIEFVATRGELMQGLPTSGVMEAFFTDEETVRRALGSIGSHVDIAALNSPRNTVVSGEPDAVMRLRDQLAGEGIPSRRLDVSVAFHSALLEPVLPRLEKAAATLAGRAPNIPFISNITGRLHQDPPAPGYWRDHARQAVRFHDGMLALRELGYGMFVEIGPGATSLALGRECVPDASAVWLASINRQKGDTRTILDSLGRLYLEGHRVDWERLAGEAPRRRVSLPTYPFERTRFWLGETTRQPIADTKDRRAPTPAKGAETLSLYPDVPDDVAKCLYHVAWEEQRAPTEEIRATEPRAWLVFADGGGVGAALVKSLEHRGDVCHVVRPDQSLAATSPRRWTLDSAKREDFDALLETVVRSERCRFGAVVFLWNLDAPSMRDMTIDDLEHAEATGARSTLYLVQALTAARGYDTSRLWVVTRGAQRVREPGEPCEPAQALLWGLGRTIALEAPNLWGGTIDLSIDRGSGEAEAESLLQNILHPGGEQQIAVRGHRRYVARIERGAGNRDDRSPIPVRSDSTYLITGGSGMLGLTVARWLVEEKGARFLALMSRGSPTAAARDELQRLEAHGARVRVLTGDVSHEPDVRRALAEIREELPPLKGVIHSAGVLADRILPQMTWETFTRATAPKVRGSWLLHQHLHGTELDFFLVQSSLLSLTGSVGQANYTAANAFLDALVDYRRSEGLPGTAINWGPWGEGGMAVGAGRRSEAAWRARGISFILPPLARRALDHVFARSIDRVAVAVCDWTRYVTEVAPPARFYSQVTTAARSVQSADELRSRESHARPAVSALRRPRAVLLQALRDQVTSELGLAGTIDTRQPLQQLGVDSLMSVNLANRLEATLGVSVPVATLVRGPSLEELADELLTAFAPGTSAGAASPEGGAAEPVRGAPRSESRGRGWLVFPQPNDAAALRLFCFNFAGGGAAPFRSWAALLAPWIDLVVIEPPGRGSRLEESPLVRLDVLLQQLMPEMRPFLDRPCAFFGHCLGALTLFEVARCLLRDGFPDLLHVFVSGARPPHRVSISGPFEENLLVRLLADPRYDPLRPVHEQPDDTFADVLRQFNIWATDDFLAQRELRALLLPAIRADFAIAASYKATPEPPWDVPITCFTGLDDHYVTREHAMEWARHTRTEFRIHFRKGNHFLVVEDRDFIVSTINAELAARVQALEGRS